MGWWSNLTFVFFRGVGIPPIRSSLLTSDILWHIDPTCDFRCIESGGWLPNWLEDSTCCDESYAMLARAKASWHPGGDNRSPWSHPRYAMVCPFLGWIHSFCGNWCVIFLCSFLHSRCILQPRFVFCLGSQPCSCPNRPCRSHTALELLSSLAPREMLGIDENNWAVLLDLLKVQKVWPTTSHQINSNDRLVYNGVTIEGWCITRKQDLSTKKITLDGMIL